MATTTTPTSVDPAREVLNQPPELAPVDYFAVDLALRLPYTNVVAAGNYELRIRQGKGVILRPAKRVEPLHRQILVVGAPPKEAPHNARNRAVRSQPARASKGPLQILLLRILLHRLQTSDSTSLPTLHLHENGLRHHFSCRRVLVHHRLLEIRDL